MALRYHISPDTGRPNICRAETRDCPVGGDHYASKDDARQAYEKTMDQATTALKSVQKDIGSRREAKQTSSRMGELRKNIEAREAKGEKLRVERESAAPARRKEINGKLRGMGITVAREKRELASLEAVEKRNSEVKQAAEKTANDHPKLFTPEPDAFSEIDGDKWVEETLKDVHSTEGPPFDEDEDEDDVWADDEETLSRPKAYSWD